MELASFLFQGQQARIAGPSSQPSGTVRAFIHVPRDGKARCARRRCSASRMMRYAAELDAIEQVLFRLNAAALITLPCLRPCRQFVRANPAPQPARLVGWSRLRPHRHCAISGAARYTIRSRTSSCWHGSRPRRGSGLAVPLRAAPRLAPCCGMGRRYLKKNFALLSSRVPVFVYEAKRKIGMFCMSCRSAMNFVRESLFDP